MSAADALSGFVAGLIEARAIVERQTDLTELVHFDKPSDFRKGVLTCLATLDAAIKEAEAPDAADPERSNR